jgi:hypothetical protein
MNIAMEQNNNLSNMNIFTSDIVTTSCSLSNVTDTV